MPYLPGLRWWRNRRLYSTRDLAKQAGLTTAAVERIERLEQKANRPTMRRLAVVLDVPPESLLQQPPERAEAIERHTGERVLHCIDPEDRDVVARAERWQTHIRAEHAELDDHFTAVERTIEAPDRIVRDKTYEARLNYYRYGVLPPPYHRLFLKVCVDYSRSDPGSLLGDVVTAYPTRRVDPKETRQWP